MARRPRTTVSRTPGGIGSFCLELGGRRQRDRVDDVEVGDGACCVFGHSVLPGRVVAVGARRRAALQKPGGRTVHEACPRAWGAVGENNRSIAFVLPIARAMSKDC